jgi:hypothetical protein
MQIGVKSHVQVTVHCRYMSSLLYSLAMRGMA